MHMLIHTHKYICMHTQAHTHTHTHTQTYRSQALSKEQDLLPRCTTHTQADTHTDAQTHMKTHRYIRIGVAGTVETARPAVVLK